MISTLRRYFCAFGVKFGVMTLGDMGKCAVASLYLRPRHEADANCDALALTAADAAHTPASALIANHCVPAMLQALHASQAQA